MHVARRHPRRVVPGALVAAAASLPLLAFACSSPVRIMTTEDGLRFRNPTERTIYYVVFERQYAARVNFAPCTDAPRCPSITPGAAETIPFARIGGYAPGAREAIVYYWHLVPTAGAGGGHIVENMRSQVVRLDGAR